jgi:hypothetical protein
MQAEDILLIKELKDYQPALQELVVADKMLVLLLVAMLIETKQAMKKRGLTCRLHAFSIFLLGLNNEYLRLRYYNC